MSPQDPREESKTENKSLFVKHEDDWMYVGDFNTDDGYCYFVACNFGEIDEVTKSLISVAAEEDKVVAILCGGKELRAQIDVNRNEHGHYNITFMVS